MNESIQELRSRLQNVTTEATFAKRQHREEAEKAVKLLSTISDEDVELLKSICPTLVNVKALTVEQIMANSNGEVASISSAISELRTYIESRLTYYEGQL